MFIPKAYQFQIVIWQGILPNCWSSSSNPKRTLTHPRHRPANYLVGLYTKDINKHQINVFRHKVFIDITCFQTNLSLSQPNEQPAWKRSSLYEDLSYLALLQDFSSEHRPWSQNFAIWNETMNGIKKKSCLPGSKFPLSQALCPVSSQLMDRIRKLLAKPKMSLVQFSWSP